ncbi:MAG: calcium-binding protein [Phenylobacterium sp.]
MVHFNGGDAEAFHTPGDKHAPDFPPETNGPQTLSGGAAAETLSGGNGDDVIDGNGGADLLLGGNGEDTIVWDPGDGSDVVDGGRGFDTMQFNTGNIGETMTLVAQDGHALLTRDVGKIVMDLDRIEHVVFGPSGGADHVTLGDLSTTDVRQVDVDFGSGADVLDASALGGHVSLTAEGGAGDDSLTGSAGDDVLAGGDGNDLLAGGGGADRFVFRAGETGRDTIVDFQGHGADGRGDVLALNGFSDHSFNEAVANHHVAQVGADVVVSDASGGIVTLQNVLVTSLHANDFAFG